MNDTEYHAKIKRLPVGEVSQTHRALMSNAEMRQLLTGTVLIQEKLDGTLEWHPDPRRSLDLFYENLRVRHTVFYDRLPSMHVILDVSDHEVLSPDRRAEFGITPPAIDHLPHSTPEDVLRMIPEYLQRKSQFATDSQIEGIIIKNYQKQLFGKVVNTEFYKGIEESGSYLRRRPVEHNRFDPQSRDAMNMRA